MRINAAEAELTENKITLSPCYIRVEDDMSHQKQSVFAKRNFSDKGL